MTIFTASEWSSNFCPGYPRVQTNCCRFSIVAYSFKIYLDIATGKTSLRTTFMLVVQTNEWTLPESLRMAHKVWDHKNEDIVYTQESPESTDSHNDKKYYISK